MNATAAPHFIPEETPIVILAEGCFGAHLGKTANGVVHYGRWPVTAVMDSTRAGLTTDQVFPRTHRQYPIVATLKEALAMSPKPQALLLGTAPIGGALDDYFKQVIEEAVEAGLHVINGLHVFLNHQPALKLRADEHKVILWDVRDPQVPQVCPKMTPRPEGVKVITMVGSDCSVGKMFTALEIDKGLCKTGDNSQFVATGQTGIMISGHGIPLDRVICDFMAGGMEYVINDVITQYHPKWVIVEGQGSLIHPAYSGVTLGLLHGSLPDAMIMCHKPSRKVIYDYAPIPSLTRLIEIYETTAGFIKPSKVLGISLNTQEFEEDEAQALVEAAEQETGLPATDPLRFGITKLVDKLQKSFQS